MFTTFKINETHEYKNSSFSVYSPSLTSYQGEIHVPLLWLANAIATKEREDETPRNGTPLLRQKQLRRWQYDGWYFQSDEYNVNVTVDDGEGWPRHCLGFRDHTLETKHHQQPWHSSQSNVTLVKYIMDDKEFLSRLKTVYRFTWKCEPWNLFLVFRCSACETFGFSPVQHFKGRHQDKTWGRYWREGRTHAHAPWLHVSLPDSLHLLYSLAPPPYSLLLVH